MMGQCFFAYCILIAQLVSVSRINAHVMHSDGNTRAVPTIKDIFADNQVAHNSDYISTRSVSNYNTLEKNTIGAYNGMVYIEFFAEDDCNGAESYATGIRAGTCLPVSEYFRPPFAEDDDYVYSLPFVAYSLNLTNSGSVCGADFNWTIVYYKDTSCTTVYEVKEVDGEHFASCKSAMRLDVSNMRSARGNCSASETLPVDMDSFVISDYTGSDNCTAPQATSFTAYAVDSCFGYGNFSSTMYSCNATSEYIQEVQYYDRTNCTLNGFEYGHSTYELYPGCNEVKTPDNDESQDDVLATTEYVGLQCFITTPTSSPTVAPTQMPTSMPSINNLVEFEATQIINSFNISTYNTNPNLYDTTLEESIAATMNGVTPQDIVDLEVTEASTESTDVAFNSIIIHSSSSSTSSTSNAVSTVYTVQVHNQSLSYDSVSTQLEGAVQSGEFDSILTSTAQQNGANALVGATSTSVTTTNLLSDSSSDDANLSTGGLVGIIVGSVFGILLIGAIVFGVYYYVGRSTPMHAQENANESVRGRGGSEL